MQFLESLYSCTFKRSGFRVIGTRILALVLLISLWGTKPHYEGYFLVGLGVLIRALAAAYLYKDKNVAERGPYFFVRHPLYLGTTFICLGFVVVLHNWLVTLLAIIFMTTSYFHTIKHEESNLKKHFGKPYEDFMSRVWILPKFSRIKLFLQDPMFAIQGFSFRQYLKNKEFECALGVLVVALYLFIGHISQN